jgi:hypothetical protein
MATPEPTATAAATPTTTAWKEEKMINQLERVSFFLDSRDSLLKEDDINDTINLPLPQSLPTQLHQMRRPQKLLLLPRQPPKKRQLHYWQHLLRHSLPCFA